MVFVLDDNVSVSVVIRCECDKHEDGHSVQLTLNRADGQTAQSLLTLSPRLSVRCVDAYVHPAQRMQQGASEFFPNGAMAPVQRGSSGPERLRQGG